MELMGMDLQVDLHLVESEGDKDDGLLGDPTAATDDLAAEVAESVGAPDAAADAKAEMAKGRVLPEPP